MKDNSETTHKRISYKNIDRVKKIGNFGESFNDVIERLLDFWESEHGKSDERYYVNEMEKIREGDKSCDEKSQSQ